MPLDSGDLESEPLRFARRLLGLKRGASSREVRAAFLRRAKVVHPDRFDPTIQREEWAEANVFLRELNEAYGLIMAVTERAEEIAKASEGQGNPANITTPSKPPPVRHNTMPPQRRHRSPPPEVTQPPIGLFDVGMFLMVGVSHFLAGNIGAILLMLILCGVDISVRWGGGNREGKLRKHLLLPRLGLSFICMPLWIATWVFGGLAFAFPWRSLGASTEWVVWSVLLLVAVTVASFWYADYRVSNRRSRM